MADNGHRHISFPVGNQKIDEDSYIHNLFAIAYQKREDKKANPIFGQQMVWFPSYLKYVVRIPIWQQGLKIHNLHNAYLSKTYFSTANVLVYLITVRTCVFTTFSLCTAKSRGVIPFTR